MNEFYGFQPEDQKNRAAVKQVVGGGGFREQEFSFRHVNFEKLIGIQGRYIHEYTCLELRGEDRAEKEKLEGIRVWLIFKAMR